jgi:hypothetical protein
LAPRAQPDAQQTPPKGNKKPCQNPLFEIANVTFLISSRIFWQGTGLETFSIPSFAKKTAPSANYTVWKKEKACAD